MSKDFAEKIKEFDEENKNHLTSSQFNKYLFKSDELTDNEKLFIENHITACNRCNSQFEEVKNNVDFYSSVSNDNFEYN